MQILVQSVFISAIINALGECVTMAIPANIKTILDNNIVEGVRVELKEGWNPETIMHTICAFANDIDNFYGGYVIIGIDDNRNVLGFDPAKFDLLQKEVVRYCKKCIEPSYIPVIDLLDCEGKKIAVLWCPAGNNRPYRCYEKVYKEKKDTKYLTYIRKGSLTLAASRDEEIELQNIGGFEPFDDRINYHFGLDAIDRGLVEEYLKLAKSSLINGLDERSIEDILLDLKAAGGPKEDYHPKNIALLMFTKKPSNFIPYSYIELTIVKNNSGDEIVEKTFDSALFKQYSDCMDFIKTNIIQKKTVKIEGKYKSKTVYNYSFEALEEIVSNAILHKSYQINEPVSIRVEKDRIEVTSIPGFDRTISDASIKELKPKSKRYQSRRIAEFLKEINIVEAKNTGYPTILQSTLDNDSPLPIIDTNKERDYVTIIVPINKHFYDENLPLKERIINALNSSPMTKTELCRFLGYARVVNSVSNQLRNLIDENYVVVTNKRYYLK